VDEVRILNPGDTDFKVGAVVLREAVEKANHAVAGKKQQAEMEAHSITFPLGKKTSTSSPRRT
jgi:DNA-directed RNA polymerase subunit beta